MQRHHEEYGGEHGRRSRRRTDIPAFREYYAEEKEYQEDGGANPAIYDEWC